jgi:hypothetical protein
LSKQQTRVQRGHSRRSHMVRTHGPDSARPSGSEPHGTPSVGERLSLANEEHTYAAGYSVSSAT